MSSRQPGTAPDGRGSAPPPPPSARSLRSARTSGVVHVPRTPARVGATARRIVALGTAASSSAAAVRRRDRSWQRTGGPPELPAGARDRARTVAVRALCWSSVVMSVGVPSAQEHRADGEGGDDVATEEHGVVHPAERSGDRLVGVTGLADAEQPAGGA